jgi:fucose 4-O-acetylase-like acetyltransferase
LGESRRSWYLDSLKCAAIMAVIVGHAFEYAPDATQSASDWMFKALLRQPLAFAVPMFLALAGYFAGGRRFETSVEQRTFWHDRLIRLVLPYLLWSAIAIALRYPDHLVSPSALAEDLFLGKGIGVGYFVIVLIQFVAITPLIASIKKDSHHIIVMATVTLAALAGRYYLSFNHPESALLAYPYFALPLVVWYPFYHLGFWIRRRKPELRSRRFVIAGMYLLFLVLSVAEAYFLGSRGLVSVADSQVKLSSFLMAGSLFLLAVACMGSGPQLPLVAWFGRNSFFVYLTHIMLMEVIAQQLNMSRMLYAGRPVYVIVLAAGTILACGLALMLAQRIAPGWLSSYWLGVDHSSRGSRQSAEGSHETGSTVMRH